MNNLIYPLNRIKFFALHRKSWENGWAYGPGFDELYLDYLVNWVYFVDYLDTLIKLRNVRHNYLYKRDNKNIVVIPFENGEIMKLHVPKGFKSFNEINSKLIKEILPTNPEGAGPTPEKEFKIFFGEAPPFFGGNYLNKDRTYFYNPYHSSPYQPWLNKPYKYFGGERKILTLTSDKPVDWKNKVPEKFDRLIYLAFEGVILLDVFPFPVWQDTNVRRLVTDSFSQHVKDYFVPYVDNVRNYIKNNIEEAISFKYAFMAPEYTSLQLMYGSRTSQFIRNLIVEDSTKSVDYYSLNPKVHKISETTFESFDNDNNPITNPDGILPYRKKPDDTHEYADKSKFLYNVINDKDWDKSELVKIPECSIECIPIYISEQQPVFTNYFNSSEELLKTKFKVKEEGK